MELQIIYFESYRRANLGLTTFYITGEAQLSVVDLSILFL
jgi:hypothetical protein